MSKGSDFKAWWKCSKGDDHEWVATVDSRNKGGGCPIYSNRKVVQSNSLAFVYPDLAKQWHSTKNGALTPSDVTFGYGKKIWWKCPKGDDHEWQATLNHRSTGTGCPKCNPVWSVPELRIFCELKPFFPRIQHRAIIDGFEVDIYIPEMKLGIEYDGVYWHQDKIEKDKEKNVGLENTIQLIRIREKELPLIGRDDISVKPGRFDQTVIKNLLEIILDQEKVNEDLKTMIYDYLNRGSWIDDELFNKLYSERKAVKYEESLCYLYPELAEEWHPIKMTLFFQSILYGNDWR